jgi:hypothetical protein
MDGGSAIRLSGTITAASTMDGENAGAFSGYIGECGQKTPYPRSSSKYNEKYT